MSVLLKKCTCGGGLPFGECVPCRCCFSTASTVTLALAGEDFSSLHAVPSLIAIPAQLIAPLTTLWFFSYTRLSAIATYEEEVEEEVWNEETEEWETVTVTVTRYQRTRITVTPPLCGPIGVGPHAGWRVSLTVEQLSYNEEEDTYDVVSTTTHHYRLSGSQDLTFQTCCASTWSVTSDLSDNTVDMTLTVNDNACCKCGSVGGTGIVLSVDPWIVAGCKSRLTATPCDETNGENQCVALPCDELPSSVSVPKPSAEQWAAFTSGLSEPFTLGDWDGTLQLDCETLTYRTTDVIFYDAGSVARGSVTLAYEQARCRWVLLYAYTAGGSKFWEGARLSLDQTPEGVYSRTAGDDTTANRTVS